MSALPDGRLMKNRNRAAVPDGNRLLAAERTYGGEKYPPGGEIPVGLCFPNRYPVGMANLGFQTILSRLREHPACDVERLFYGDDDRELLSFESGRPAAGFSLLAFSISFENDYVHMLKMLERAGVPLRREDRGDGDPLIVVGGAITFLNPEPLRPFVDIFLLGEGEEMVGELIDMYASSRSLSRRAIVEKIAALEGAYAPLVHRFSGEVEPRRYDSMKTDPAASRIVTPYSEFRDTLLLEISRGCPRRCRFCTVGSALPKFRMLSADRAVEIAEGFREEDRRAGREPLRKVGLVSAAFFDHTESGKMAGELSRRGFEIGVSSLRVDQLTDEVLGYLRAGGLRTITVAPEAGSDRLRRVIRKEASDEVILEGVKKAARAGFRAIRIYYMIGLPLEEEEDREALVRQALEIRSTFLSAGSAGGQVTVSLHPFVPKPRTPFQWSAMIRPPQLKRMVWKLRRKLPGVKVKCVPRREAYIEGILSRGGEELAPFLESVAAGETWPNAARACGIDLDRILYGERDREAPLPWEAPSHERRSRSVDLRELERAEEVGMQETGGEKS